MAYLLNASEIRGRPGDAAFCHILLLGRGLGLPWWGSRACMGVVVICILSVPIQSFKKEKTGSWMIMTGS